MEIVSERVSIDRADGRLSVVISARLPKSKEALVVAWSIAWFASGVYVAIARAGLPDGDPKRQFWLVFLAFWRISWCAWAVRCCGASRALNCGG
jgi:hypothetical protein